MIRLLLLASLAAAAVEECPRYESDIDERLRVLTIEDFTYGRVDSATFDGVERALPQLDTLVLRNTAIRLIAPNTFGQLRTLRCLDLAENLLSVLFDTAFRGLRSLDTLILATNAVQRVDESAFIYVRRLKRLDLSDNLLLALPDSALRGLTQLEHLDLSGNQLSQLSPLLFNHTPALRRLSVARNPLHLLGVAALPNLHSVNASFTDLSILPHFPMRVRSVDLRSAALAAISPDRSPDLWGFTNLWLAGNEWNCSCENFWFIQWTNVSSAAVDFELLTCDTPLAIRELPFASALLELDCPNQANTSVLIHTEVETQMLVPVNFVRDDQPQDKTTPVFVVPNATDAITHSTGIVTTGLPKSAIEHFTTGQQADAITVQNSTTILQWRTISNLSVNELLPPLTTTTREKEPLTEQQVVSLAASTAQPVNVARAGNNAATDHSYPCSPRNKRHNWLHILSMALGIGMLFFLLFACCAVCWLALLRRRRRRNRLRPHWSRVTTPIATVSQLNTDVYLQNSSLVGRAQTDTLCSYVPRHLALPRDEPPQPQSAAPSPHVSERSLTELTADGPASLYFDSASTTIKSPYPFTHVIAYN